MKVAVDSSPILRPRSAPCPISATQPSIPASSRTSQPPGPAYKTMTPLRVNPSGSRRSDVLDLDGDAGGRRRCRSTSPPAGAVGAFQKVRWQSCCTPHRRAGGLREQVIPGRISSVTGSGPPGSGECQSRPGRWSRSRLFRVVHGEHAPPEGSRCPPPASRSSGPSHQDRVPTVRALLTAATSSCTLLSSLGHRYNSQIAILVLLGTKRMAA